MKLAHELSFRILTYFVLLLKHASSKGKMKTIENDFRNFVQQLMSSAAAAAAVCSACWWCSSQQWLSMFRSVIGNESPVLMLCDILLKQMLDKLVKLFYGSESWITMFARVQRLLEFSSGHVVWTPWCVTYLVQFFLKVSLRCISVTFCYCSLFVIFGNKTRSKWRTV